MTNLRHFPCLSPFLRPFLRAALALLALALGGWLLSPAVRHLRQEEFDAHLRFSGEGAHAADALSQQLSFFTLGGLRSLAAEMLTLDATSAWIEHDWPRAQRRWEQITNLAPRRVNYWIRASRDMATNAAADTSRDPELSVHERATLTQAYIARGERFLLDGISHHPKSMLLHARLGDLYSDIYRRPRFARAAEAYHRAVELGAPSIYERQEFYNLCRIRGREEEAWELGRRLYEQPHHRVPSVRSLLFVLQHRISVPREQSISPAELFGSEAAARRELKSFVNNHLLFPIDGIKAYLEHPPAP